jgi:uncharacterized protein (DUF58 family)
MSITDRFKAAAVLGAILMLTVAISGAFIDTSALFELVLKSWIFWLLFTVASLLAAPLLTRYIPAKTEEGRPFGAWGVILVGVAIVIGGVAVLASLMNH